MNQLQINLSDEVQKGYSDPTEKEVIYTCIQSRPIRGKSVTNQVWRTGHQEITEYFRILRSLHMLPHKHYLVSIKANIFELILFIFKNNWFCTDSPNKQFVHTLQQRWLILKISKCKQTLTNLYIALSKQNKLCTCS